MNLRKMELQITLNTQMDISKALPPFACSA